MADDHLVALEEEDLLELAPRQLVAFVQLALLELPQGRLARPQQLLLLLQKLALEQRNLLAVAVAEAPQRRLDRLRQPVQVVLLAFRLSRSTTKSATETTTTTTTTFSVPAGTSGTYRYAEPW